MSVDLRQEIRKLVGKATGVYYNYSTASRKYREDFDEVVSLIETLCINVDNDEYNGQ